MNYTIRHRKIGVFDDESIGNTYPHSTGPLILFSQTNLIHLEILDSET